MHACRCFFVFDIDFTPHCEDPTPLFNPLHEAGNSTDLCISVSDYASLFDHGLGPDCIPGTYDDEDDDDDDGDGDDGDDGDDGGDEDELDPSKTVIDILITNTVDEDGIRYVTTETTTTTDNCDCTETVILSRKIEAFEGEELKASAESVVSDITQPIENCPDDGDGDQDDDDNDDGGDDGGDVEEVDPEKVVVRVRITTSVDDDGRKKVTTVTTTTTDNCDCTETIVVHKKIELFGPEPDCELIGSVEGVISETT